MLIRLHTIYRRDIIISSCCHSVNLLIKRYYPECLEYLADAFSPMLAHGKDIKERYGDDYKVIFIGPCIAKKDEVDNSDFIDAALTFKELDLLFYNFESINDFNKFIIRKRKELTNLLDETIIKEINNRIINPILYYFFYFNDRAFTTYFRRIIF